MHRIAARSTRRANFYVGEFGAVVNGSKFLTSFMKEGSYWVASHQTHEQPRKTTVPLRGSS
jgi:hypothetical protein